MPRCGEVHRRKHGVVFGEDPFEKFPVPGMKGSEPLALESGPKEAHRGHGLETEAPGRCREPDALEARPPRKKSA